MNFQFILVTRKNNIHNKLIQTIFLGKVIPVVCAKLISRKEQSITQQNVSNGWYY